MRPKKRVATVLTACGIETTMMQELSYQKLRKVATVLTACGIETAKAKIKT